MNWTKEKPTKSGWYVIRPVKSDMFDNGWPDICRIFNQNSELYIAYCGCDEDDERRLKEIPTCWWMGPLRLPKASPCEQ